MTHTANPLSLFLITLSVLALGACSSSGDSAPETSLTESAGVRIDRALDKALSDARASGNPQALLAVLEPYYNRHKDNPVIAAEYARALREDEQLNSAKRVLLPFATKENGHVETWTELAMTSLSLGEYKEAQNAAKAATNLDDDAGRAWLALGTALDAQGYYEEAEEAFRTGLRVWDGDAAPILNNLALNLASQGDFKEALTILDRARQKYPQRVELERNYRIISTLHDVTPAEPAPRPTAKPTAQPTLDDDAATKAAAQAAEQAILNDNKQDEAEQEEMEKEVEALKEEIEGDEDQSSAPNNSVSHRRFND